MLTATTTAEAAPSAAVATTAAPITAKATPAAIAAPLHPFPHPLLEEPPDVVAARSVAV